MSERTRATERGVQDVPVPAVIIEDVLIFGPPARRPQIGRAFPAMVFALLGPRAGFEGRAVLHAMGCPDLPTHREGHTVDGREIVYSTTYAEIDDHAAREFGEDGRIDCPVCVCMRGR